IRDFRVTGVQTCALPIWSDPLDIEGDIEPVYRRSQGFGVGERHVPLSFDGGHHGAGAGGFAQLKARLLTSDVLAKRGSLTLGHEGKPLKRDDIAVPR